MIHHCCHWIATVIVDIYDKKGAIIAIVIIWQSWPSHRHLNCADQGRSPMATLAMSTAPLSMGCIIGINGSQFVPFLWPLAPMVRYPIHYDPFTKRWCTSWFKGHESWCISWNWSRASLRSPESLLSQNYIQEVSLQLMELDRILFLIDYTENMIRYSMMCTCQPS